MTARIIIGLAIVWAAGLFLGHGRYGLGVTLAVILSSWLLALVLAFPAPGPSRSDRARAQARARVCRMEAADLREWARIIDDDDFDPAELPPGPVVASLRGAADALENEVATVSRYAREARPC